MGENREKGAVAAKKGGFFGGGALSLGKLFFKGAVAGRLPGGAAKTPEFEVIFYFRKFFWVLGASNLSPPRVLV